MVATLDSEGGWIPPMYIKTQSGSASKASGRRPEVGEKPVKGMNNELMKEYADHIDRYVDRPSRLIYDRLSSHTAKATIQYIESKKCTDGRQKFKVCKIPPKGAFLVSALDNGFFAYWKEMFHRFDRSTPQLKFWAANQTWKLVQEEIVKGFFDNCLLTGRKKEKTIRRELHDRVRYGVPEELEEEWEFYQGWLAGAYDVEGVSGPREAALDSPTQLEDSALDGLYWNKWGPHGKKL